MQAPPSFSNKILKFIHCIIRLLLFCNAGEAVTVEDEVVVINSIVLPNKTLNVSVQEDIIL